MIQYSFLADQGSYVATVKGVEYWTLQGKLFAAVYAGGDENPPTIRTAHVRELKGLEKIAN